MRRLGTILISGLIFLVGLGILAYPTVSNWLHQQHASHAMQEYFQQANKQSNSETLAEFDQARAYNRTLSGDLSSLLEAVNMQAENIQNPAYWDTLNAINGMMGVVEIPSIDVSLPIYHGTDELTLQQGVGHLEGSALPTGAVGEHSVLTGHTGLPRAELFTDLDMVEVGDVFYLEILDQTFTYEVKNIYTVLPSETDHLVAQPDKNMATLVTCTPYGINSHRLLVQGERRMDVPTAPAPQAEEILFPDTTETPLALQNVPLLIGIAATIGVLFCGAAIHFILSTRHQPKRLQKHGEHR